MRTIVVSIFILTCVMVFLTACRTQPAEQENDVRSLAKQYFEHYARRDNWKGFLDRYHEALIFHDRIAGVSLASRAAFEEFYFWPDTAFRKHPDHEKTLVVNSLAVDDSVAIGSGFFTPFIYNGTVYAEQEEMSFTIFLYFNSEGKIVRQTDWIDYPAEIMKTIVCK